MATGHEFHSETFFTTRRPSRLTCHPRATEFFQSTSVSCLMPFGDASIARSILLSCSSRPICPLISQCTACLWKNVGATQGEERSYQKRKQQRNERPGSKEGKEEEMMTREEWQLFRPHTTQGTSVRPDNLQRNCKPQGR